MGRESGSRYSKEIKEFAISLYFYSPRAYRFVRKSLHLPHPFTIRSWSVSIDCEPGFLQKSINHIAGKVNEGEKDCDIIIDEMSMREQLRWDKKNSKFAHDTDYGHIKAEEPDTIAKNALVLMVSGLKMPWFVPMAYFFYI